MGPGACWRGQRVGQGLGGARPAVGDACVCILGWNNTACGAVRSRRWLRSAAGRRRRGVGGVGGVGASIACVTAASFPPAWGRAARGCVAVTDIISVYFYNKIIALIQDRVLFWRASMRFGYPLGIWTHSLKLVRRNTNVPAQHAPARQPPAQPPKQPTLLVDSRRDLASCTQTRDCWHWLEQQQVALPACPVASGAFPGGHPRRIHCHPTLDARATHPERPSHGHAALTTHRLSLHRVSPRRGALHRPRARPSCSGQRAHAKLVQRL